MPEDVDLTAGDEEQREGRGDSGADEQGAVQQGSDRVAAPPVSDVLPGFGLAGGDDRGGEIGLGREVRITET